MKRLISSTWSLAPRVSSGCGPLIALPLLSMSSGESDVPASLLATRVQDALNDRGSQAPATRMLRSVARKAVVKAVNVSRVLSLCVFLYRPVCFLRARCLAGRGRHGLLARRPRLDPRRRPRLPGPTRRKPAINWSGCGISTGRPRQKHDDADFAGWSHSLTALPRSAPHSSPLDPTVSALHLARTRKQSRWMSYCMCVAYRRITQRCGHSRKTRACT